MARGCPLTTQNWPNIRIGKISGLKLAAAAPFNLTTDNQHIYTDNHGKKVKKIGRIVHGDWGRYRKK